MPVDIEQSELHQRIGLPVGSGIGERCFYLHHTLISGVHTHVPAEYADEFTAKREELLEAIAETDDGLMEKVLEGKTTIDEVMRVTQLD